MTMAPHRGRRGWERRVDAQVARATADRTADRDAADAAGAAAGDTDRGPESHGAGRRLPDLSGLPPLLAGSGAFETLRERLRSTDGSAATAADGSHAPGVAPGAAGSAPRAPDVGTAPHAPDTAPHAPRAAGSAPHASLTQVPHGAKSYLAAALVLSAGERILWVARDAEIGDRVAEELAAWVGDIGAVAVLEPRTALAYERSELVADETAARVAALAAWRSGRARILVASVQALIQHTIEPALLPATPRELRVGARVTQTVLLRELLELGYSPVLEVAGKGEFARRGGIVDVFPPSAVLPVRIELFGDEVDSLRTFDPTDQRTTGLTELVTLLPASEFLLPRDAGAVLGERLGTLAGSLPERMAGDLERLTGTVRGDPERPHAASAVERPRASSAVERPPGSSPTDPVTGSSAADVGDAAEIWAPILAPSTGLDHVDPQTLLVLDEPGDLADAAEFLWRQSDERRIELTESGDLPRRWPETLLGRKAWAARLRGHRTLELTWESAAPSAAIARGALSAGDLFGWSEPSLPIGRAANVGKVVTAWRSADGTPPRIVIASDQAPRLSELLAQEGHHAAATGRVTEPPPPGAVVLIERSLNGGFAGGPDGLVFVTDRELFGNVRIRRPKAMRRVVPRDILERLTAGDLVVHIDHGVARYERMLRRSAGEGDERDYLEISFAAGDRIYVPVEQIARITRYSGGERPQLSKLGGTEWLRTKQRVRRAVADLAEELLRLYAARVSAAGHGFAPDSPWQGEMEASFPYEETPDQLRAVLEMKHDMEAGRPMDRLVVGDVGYGKTEVALRGAFKAIQDGKQVAVLVPTTVLAAQHHATFTARFATFPVRVGILSRFVAAKEQQQTLAGLSDGSVDLVIGTHRLLSKDVRFRDLGLLVVDEEQRFGVAAKERLKQIRREVDVLTLSATPIPRTLNLALAGIRDMSVIETPPEDRLPIQTRVAEASAGLVRDAILRELDRGGQVFYVHNRVETIEAQAEQIRRMLPDIRIVVGHGQMAEGHLESVMLAFASGQADILVCTTIIESGLDIPNANTIIIDRADTLGLAQLYQLRGRVGRSARRAYAYLLYRRRERMSDDARKRLQAIFNASELGAGFQIALSDLEIRGAGNILGGEQSGHMAAVGFDLYSRMLAEAVEEGKATREGRPAMVEAPSAVVDLPLEAHLPDDYVPDVAQKLELYRRLARARTAGDLAAFRQEVMDRFGPMPPPVVRLAEVAELRLAAEGAGVSSISREDGQLVVRFGAGLSRATAMALLGPGALPGVRPSEVTFASNQVRIRLPKDPRKGWGLTQAVVARLSTPGAVAG